MEARMTNPALSVPGLLDALQALSKAANEAAGTAGVPRATMDLIGLRASQINGCSVCLDMHTRGARKAGESDERLHTLAAWRHTPYFTDAERAVLALTEAGTRLADVAGDIPDGVFDEAARYFDAGPRRAGGRHRGDQHLEPAECHVPADRGRVDGAVGVTGQTAGSQCRRSAAANSAARSSGKNSRAPSSSITSVAPGIVSRSQ